MLVLAVVALAIPSVFNHTSVEGDMLPARDAGEHLAWAWRW
ncbi:MAG: hypothetical protein V9F04_16895 [Dermatophilaceae bacterium]